MFSDRSNGDKPAGEPDYLGGDPVAFGALVTRYQESLFGYLGRMGFGQAACEDLAQEAFLRAWKNREKYNPDKASVSTWLFTITRNLALTALARKIPTVSEEIDVELQPQTGTGADPSRQYEHHQSVVRLRLALNKLSVEDREVIAVCYTPELENSAEILNCSAGALRTRLSRARKRLSAALTDLDK